MTEYAMLSSDDISKLFLFASERNKAIITLLLNTGMTVSELCRLSWTHVCDFENLDKACLLFKNSPRGKQRKIPLNQQALDALKVLGNGAFPDRGYILKPGSKRRITPRAIQLMIKRVALKAGLDDVTPMLLRHTFSQQIVQASSSMIEAIDVLKDITDRQEAALIRYNRKLPNKPPVRAIICRIYQERPPVADTDCI